MRHPDWLAIRIQMIALAALCAALAPLPAQAWTFKTIHTFCSMRFCGDGYQPVARPTLAPTGELYGTTTFSDTNGDLPGSVYRLAYDSAKSRWKLLTLYKFCEGGYPCLDGAYPEGGVIVDTSGNLYGTTDSGGSKNAGVVFKLIPTSNPRKWLQKVLYNFGSMNSGADGGLPTGTLTYAGASSGQPYDGASPLYGATENGGTNGRGTVFEVIPNGDTATEQVLYSFCAQQNCTDGQQPFGAVLLDGSGDIFGSTADGGKYGFGVAFQLNSTGDGWTETVLHDFCALKKCRDGANPEELTIDSTGALFGATYSGGMHGCCGILFRLVPNGAQSQYQVLYRFCSLRDCKDGANPSAPLTIDSSGNIFGTARAGGGNDLYNYAGGGTVFELTGSSLQVLYRFCAKHLCGDGGDPSSGVIFDGAGDLIGTTAIDGKGGGGTVFKLSP
jgi:uncharacterized repeat protein (TIGR03803 family)